MELNTESIIIKNLIVNGEFFGKTMPILKKKYFLDVGAQNIFELLKNHYSNYKVIPSITDLVASVQNIQTDETRTNVIESLKFINAIPESTNIEHMLDETVSFVKDAMYTEALLLGSDGLVQKNSDKKIQAQAIMEEMSKLSIDTDLGLDFEDIEVMIKYYQEKLLGIKTQHEEFNKRLGAGFLPGTLSIIMAPSGGGKSLLMTDFISGMMKEGKNILLVSMEMLDKELMKRIHANALDLPINDLRELPENVIRNAYDNVKDTCGKFFIKDYPPGSFSPLMLEQLIESYKVEKNIEFDIIYLDYLGIMKSDLVSPSAGLYSYVKSIVEETRAIAVKHKLPIISASQLNRCLWSNTQVRTNKGDVPIKDIKIGDILSTGVEVVSKVHTGKQKGYKITLKSGKEIIASANHKFPTNKGTMTINVGLSKGQFLKSIKK